ncbi:uncharacterized protein K452DRAFT_319202 [Aplosporella prunicola CBS 121167]|uniref:Heterokaryon incompatibility domain-containing protein n=1 Tax=Aplosporella prunicola CBS 121167 TaxID=1176127 RepID=A0A6A6BBD4_9PEZI|nr:uncharacterized protein K452DRAFT_319202 [Aplosporella prunicola CBS 121167]KAF2140908.1 hypothetical protein K452DRAFT_319202 [Aplosporella prunicola CBS 121167]
MIPPYEEKNVGNRPIYRPLRNRHIRLVCIEPADQSLSELRCRLVHMPLEGVGAADYMALSYTWGGYETEAHVFLTDSCKSLAITTNCAQAIRWLRLKAEIRLVWIDAISIDQSNVQERNSQVRMMGDIYRNAGLVIVYLGEESCHTSMKEISNADVSKRKSKDIAPDILYKPWFRRIWVIQEVVLSKAAMVICGEACISWDCFVMWANRHRSLALPGVLSYGSGFSPTKKTLLHQLQATRGSRASDPRDKVIALLGLLPHEEFLLYSPLIDYRLRTEITYAKTASMVIQAERSLRVLSAVQNSSYRYLKLPSWVPDWSIPSRQKVLGIDATMGEPYDAGGRPAHCEIIREEILRATGLEIGRVVGMTMPASDLNKWYEYFKAHWRSSPKISKQDHDLKPSQIFQKIITGRASSTIDSSWTDPKPHSRSLLFGKRMAPEIRRRAQRVCSRRLLFRTETGLFGIAPVDTRKDDVVCVLLGGPTPYILRREGPESKYFALVGECYVYGMMNGQALAHLEAKLRAAGHVFCSAATATAAEWPCSAPLRDFVIR